MRRAVLMFVLIGVFFVAGTASAQWRGMGRVTGKILDEAGTPVEGVLVKGELPGQGGTFTKTDAKGEWALGGIARGEWVFTFSKDGLTPQKAKFLVREMELLPPLKTNLKKAN